MAGISYNMTHLAGAVSPTYTTTQTFWVKYDNNKLISVFNIIIFNIISSLISFYISLLVSLMSFFSYHLSLFYLYYLFWLH